MVQSPPDGYPRVVPYLMYEDAAAALEWIARVTGFKERMRMEEGGRVTHAEVEMADGVVMLGSPGEGFEAPHKRGGSPTLVHVYLEDVDAHHDAAVAAGAEVTRELTDQPYGDRSYQITDPEGHLWYFAQHVRDVSPEEMGG